MWKKLKFSTLFIRNLTTHVELKVFKIFAHFFEQEVFENVLFSAEIRNLKLYLIGYIFE